MKQTNQEKKKHKMWFLLSRTSSLVRKTKHSSVKSLITIYMWVHQAVCCVWSCAGPGTLLTGDRTAVTTDSPYSLAESTQDSTPVFLEKDLRLLSAEMFDFLDRKAPLTESSLDLGEDRNSRNRNESGVSHPEISLSPREDAVTLSHAEACF